MLPREYSQAELSPGPAQGRGEDFQRIPTEFSWLSPRVNTHPHPQSSEKGPHGRSPGGIQTSPKVLWRLRACFTILLLLHMDHRVLPLRRDLTKLTENPSTTLSLGSFFLLQLKSWKKCREMPVQENQSHTEEPSGSHERACAFSLGSLFFLLSGGSTDMFSIWNIPGVLQLMLSPQK